VHFLITLLKQYNKKCLTRTNKLTGSQLNLLNEIVTKE